jgi:hypothetical protein
MSSHPLAKMFRRVAELACVNVSCYSAQTTLVACLGGALRRSFGFTFTSSILAPLGLLRILATYTRLPIVNAQLRQLVLLSLVELDFVKVLRKSNTTPAVFYQYRYVDQMNTRHLLQVVELHVPCLILDGDLFLCRITFAATICKDVQRTLVRFNNL